MLVRTATMIASFALLITGLILQLLYPALAVYIFWTFLVWLIASLFLFRMPAMSRPIGGPASTPSLSQASQALPSAAGSAPTHSSSLGFCVYCAGPIEPGTAVCPACGHRIPNF